VVAVLAHHVFGAETQMDREAGPDPAEGPGYADAPGLRDTDRSEWRGGSDDAGGEIRVAQGVVEGDEGPHAVADEEDRFASWHAPGAHEVEVVEVVLPAVDMPAAAVRQAMPAMVMGDHAQAPGDQLLRNPGVASPVFADAVLDEDRRARCAGRPPFPHVDRTPGGVGESGFQDHGGKTTAERSALSDSIPDE
jgi:hypothetical protein